MMVTSAALAAAPDTLPITVKLLSCCNLANVTALALIFNVVTAESANLPVVTPRSLILSVSELISIVALSTLTSNVTTGTAPLIVTSTTLVPNLYVARANVADFDVISTVSTGNYYLTMANALTGNIATSANSVFVANTANGAITATTFVGALSGAATTAGTVTTAAQGNITSLGTLTGLTSTGVVNFTGASNVSLGSNANIKITGGTTGQVLSTDGSGNLSWATSGGGTPGGANTQVQFNDSSAFGGNAGLTFNKTTTTLTANNFVATSTANLGSNANVIITGGTNGYVLSTNGSGGLSWIASGGGGGGATITNDTTTNSNAFYPVFTSTTSGTMSTASVSTTKLYYNPSTGTVNATVFNSLSDRTKKSNIELITNALNKVLTLNGVTFNLVDSNEPSAGLIAQDVQEVLPSAVKFDDINKVLSLNYSGVIGLLVEAIKEQQLQIDELKQLIKKQV